MSGENVEICKRAFALLARLDVESGLEYVDPDIEFQSAIVSGAEGGTYSGYDGLRAWAAESEAAFEELRTVPDEFRDLGGDAVLVLGHIYARGRESGVAVESPVAFIFKFRGDRVIRARGFLDQDEALKAAGIQE
jgi:ketosteroid isomerase-like protein